VSTEWQFQNKVITMNTPIKLDPSEIDLDGITALSLDDLKKKKSKGAKWAKIDGQSRNKLALKPFFESDIAIDKSMIIEHIDVETQEIKDSEDVNGVLFKDMSLETKEFLKTTEGGLKQEIDIVGLKKALGLVGNRKSLTYDRTKEMISL